jgi:hypothetical protein
MSAWLLERQDQAVASTMATGKLQQQLVMAVVASPWATGSSHLETDLQRT